MPCSLIYVGYVLNALKWRLCHIIQVLIWKTTYSEIKKKILVASQLDQHKRTGVLTQKSHVQNWNYPGLCKNRNLFP